MNTITVKGHRANVSTSALIKPTSLISATQSLLFLRFSPLTQGGAHSTYAFLHVHFTRHIESTSSAQCVNLHRNTF